MKTVFYDNCANCGKRFVISASARCRKRKHNKEVFCSKTCAHIYRGHHVGGYEIKCKTCGKEIIAAYKDKIFCSLDCYIADEEMQERLKSWRDKRRNAITVECANCKKEITRKMSKIGKNNFCDQSCYREFMAGRFDRYINSDLTIEQMNNYDEFLSREILPCPVDGCNWEGEQLSLHMNFEHGINAKEFKDLAGFNQSTAVVTKDVLQKYKDVDRTYALDNLNNIITEEYRRSPWPKHSASRECKEHIKKSRGLYQGSEFVCPICGKTFTRVHYGKQIYCSIPCRDIAYKEKYSLKGVVNG